MSTDGQCTICHRNIVKITTAWVGRTSVTEDRQTDGRQHTVKWTWVHVRYKPSRNRLIRSSGKTVLLTMVNINVRSVVKLIILCSGKWMLYVILLSCCCYVRSRDRLELRHRIEGHQLGVISVDVNKQGTVAASSSLNSQIRLWDVESGKLIKDIDAGPGLSLLVSVSLVHLISHLQVMVPPQFSCPRRKPLWISNDFQWTRRRCCHPANTVKEPQALQYSAIQYKFI